MVALFRCLGRLHLVVIINQLGIILVGFAAQETIVTLETTPQWPAVIRTGSRNLVGRSQVPFANGIGVITILQQDF